MFDGKVAVITGGAQGIGKTIADEFRKNHAKVSVIDIKKGDYFVGDLSNKDVLEEYAEYVISNFGHIDYLINNALPSTLLSFKALCSVFQQRWFYHQYIFVKGQDESAADRKLYSGKRRNCRAHSCNGRQLCRKDQS